MGSLTGAVASTDILFRYAQPYFLEVIKKDAQKTAALSPYYSPYLMYGPNNRIRIRPPIISFMMGRLQFISIPPFI